MRKDIDCPYCGKEQDINHDDGYGYSEDDLHQQQCGYCDKTFTYTTSISFYYEAQKADCLNDGEHDWKITATIPVKYRKMRCTTCHEERPLTDQEQLENAQH